MIDTDGQCYHLLGKPHKRSMCNDRSTTVEKMNISTFHSLESITDYYQSLNGTTIQLGVMNCNCLDDKWCDKCEMINCSDLYKFVHKRSRQHWTFDSKLELIKQTTNNCYPSGVNKE